MKRAAVLAAALLLSGCSVPPPPAAAQGSPEMIADLPLGYVMRVDDDERDVVCYVVQRDPNSAISCIAGRGK